MVHLTSNESIPEHMTTFKPTSPDCLCQYVNEPVKVSVMKHLWHTSNCILLNYAQLLAPSFAIILLHLMLYLSQIHSFPQFPTFYLRYSELNLHSLLWIMIIHRWLKMHMLREPSHTYFLPICDLVSQLLLATGLGNMPVVVDWNAKTGRFGSRPLQKPDPLPLGGPHPDSYRSTTGFCKAWQDPSVPISGFALRVSLFIVTFR